VNLAILLPFSRTGVKHNLEVNDMNTRTPQGEWIRCHEMDKSCEGSLMESADCLYCNE
jgi:hypothetical protein